MTIQEAKQILLNKQTNEWDTPLPKKGNIIVWNGNTFLYVYNYDVIDIGCVTW